MKIQKPKASLQFHFVTENSIVEITGIIKHNKCSF